MTLYDQHNRPMASVAPSREVVEIRREIKHALGNIRSYYDASQTTNQNQRHWQPANNLSPNAVNRLTIRKTLRRRSRYEVSNNGYLKGILLSLCQDFVGSGPSLQVTDHRFQRRNSSSNNNGTSKNRLSAILNPTELEAIHTNDSSKSITPAVVIEKLWKQRAKKIKLRQKLWQLRHAKCQDGESFLFAFNNRNLNLKITLDQKVFETDQVSNFDETINTSRRNRAQIDGIRFDRQSGEPTSYYLLHEHPGEDQFFSLASLVTDGKWVGARNVIHWFRKDRPWLRGIPETTYTLPLWALLRRYTLAVVQNAEIAADFTVLLKTMQLPFAEAFGQDGTGGVTPDNKELWFDGFPVDRGMIVPMPDGYDISQLKPEQPVTVYDGFVAALVGEASRPLLSPRNTAMLDSGNSNMSAGVHDTQTYRQAIESERLDCNDEVLDKDYHQWWFEAIRTPEYFGDALAEAGLPRNTISQIVQRFPSLREEPPQNTYRWDQVPEHTDPAKVASAIKTMHDEGFITDQDIQEKRFNRSVEDHHQTRMEEANRKQQLIDAYPDQFEKAVDPNKQLEQQAASNGSSNGSKTSSNGSKK